MDEVGLGDRSGPWTIRPRPGADPQTDWVGQIGHRRDQIGHKGRPTKTDIMSDLTTRQTRLDRLDSLTRLNRMVPEGNQTSLYRLDRLDSLQTSLI